MKLAHDRGGTVHIMNPKTPNKNDPWQRALCGDPGNFMIFNEKCPCCGHKMKLPRVSCKDCLKVLKRGRSSIG